MLGFCKVKGFLISAGAACLLGLLVIAAPFSVSAHAGQVVDRVVGVVNDDVIRLRELNRELEPVKERLQSRGLSGEEFEKQLYDARERILDEMINDKLAEQQIEDAGISVGQGQVDSAIERIKQKNQYTDKELRQALQMRGMTMEEYRGEIKRQILRSRLVNREIKSNIVITNDEIRRYYEEHPEKYGGKVKYELRNILMRSPEAVGTDSKTKLREQMQKVAEKLKSGASFEQMARDYSEAPNASDGGALGKFALEDLSRDLRPVIKNLEEGEFSDIVETNPGLQFFYVEDIVTTEPKPLDEVSDEIHSTLYEQQVNEKYSDWIASLRQRAYIRKIR
ncbi:MAG: SurA N-terminal domain-containing protein [Desulfobacteraceae bacterium]|nr:SurA N-terminal domain-containing protein [Desulfobacteraceae bacterium]MCF8094551.1 SurA N-terminal domain-containing protein [Desulfobacteraceae bacterium]